jgi:hypothetical protein
MPQQTVADAAAAARLALDRAEKRHPAAAGDLASVRRALEIITAATAVHADAATIAHYQALADEVAALELDTPAGRLRADGPLVRGGEPGAGWWDQ